MNMAESDPGVFIATLPSRQQTFVKPEIRGMQRMLGSEPQCRATGRVDMTVNPPCPSQRRCAIGAAVPLRQVRWPKPALMAAGTIPYLLHRARTIFECISIAIPCEVKGYIW